MGCPTTTLLQVSFPTDPTVRWIVLGFVAFALVYITFIRPQRKKNRKDPLAKPPGSSGLAQQRSVEREMSNLLVEMSEMARQMTAQLDTRAAKLELLIKEADAKIEALKRAQAGITTLPPAEATAADEDSSPEVIEDNAPRPPAPDARHVAIYELADQGRSVHEIAQMLGQPSGEIELILNFRRGA